MVKKIICVILIVLFCLSLVGCGKKNITVNCSICGKEFELPNNKAALITSAFGDVVCSSCKQFSSIY